MSITINNKKDLSSMSIDELLAEAIERITKDRRNYTRIKGVAGYNR